MRKQMETRFMKIGMPVFAAATLVCSLLLATTPGVWAQQLPAAPGIAPAKSAHQNQVDRVEARIAKLHEKLQITAAQERAWNEFAQAMRDNAKTMKAMLDQRAQQRNKLDAVGELRSHAEMADLYAAGLHKLVPTFEALYNTMPEGQKKIADKVMTYREGHHRKRSK